MKLRNQLRQFLQGMLQVCPTMDCTVSCHVYQSPPAVQLHPFNNEQQQEDEDEDDYDFVYDRHDANATNATSAISPAPGAVLVDVGLVDRQVATLWWALAQQTARVARRYVNNTIPSSSNVATADGIQSYADAGGGAHCKAPMTSLTSRTAARAPAEPSFIVPERTELLGPVGDLTLWQCNSSSTSSSNRTHRSNSSYNRNPSDSSMSSMSTTMTSPRLVRELCQKFPPPGFPVYESYVYETPQKDGANGPVKLLRYVRVAQSASAENLPVASPNESSSVSTGTPGTATTLRSSFRRPKSEMMLRKFSGNQQELAPTNQNRSEDISSSGECVQYESQDLGNDVDDVDSGNPAASYSPIVVVVSCSFLLPNRYFDGAVNSFNV